MNLSIMKVINTKLIERSG